jgi:hypothetical protein
MDMQSRWSANKGRFFFDMAGRFPWPAGEYGRGFRIGDRAGAYMRVLHWRGLNPEEPLLILEDLTWPECYYAGEFTADWLFAGLADEIRFLQSGETIDRPAENNLYDRSMWFFWRDLRSDKPEWLIPNIQPPDAYRMRAEAFRAKHACLRDGFVVVQPLFDAGYNHYRNCDWSWWVRLISRLQEQYPVVVAVSNVHTALPRDGIEGAPFTVDGFLSPMDVLALIQMSRLFVGGETGLTLWAPILQTPTYGLISEYALSLPNDTAPISFGAPVDIQALENEPEAHAERIKALVTCHSLLP